MAKFSEEFSDLLLAEQNGPTLKEVSDSSTHKSVSTIWGNFGESLEAAGLAGDSLSDNKENMSASLNVKQKSSEEGTDSQENGHEEERKLSDVTFVPDSDEDEIGSSQVIFHQSIM